jgi:hypothetical protein
MHREEEEKIEKIQPHCVSFKAANSSHHHSCTIRVLFGPLVTRPRHHAVAAIRRLGGSPISDPQQLFSLRRPVVVVVFFRLLAADGEGFSRSQQQDSLVQHRDEL